ESVAPALPNAFFACFPSLFSSLAVQPLDSTGTVVWDFWGGFYRLFLPTSHRFAQWHSFQTSSLSFLSDGMSAFSDDALLPALSLSLCLSRVSWARELEVSDRFHLSAVRALLYVCVFELVEIVVGGCSLFGVGKINKEKEMKTEKGEKQGRGKEEERKGLKKAKTLCMACVKDQVACIFWGDAQPRNGKVACVNCSHRKAPIFDMDSGDEENPIKIISSESVQQPLSGLSHALNNKHNLLSIIDAQATLLTQLEHHMEREITGLKHWEKDLSCQIDILENGAYNLWKDLDNWQNIPNLSAGDIRPDIGQQQPQLKPCQAQVQSLAGTQWQISLF
ncbi:hypothetical protein DL96DRAFT_1804513, partial [Flagelloscypha sp. PMI_526]